MRDFRDGLLGLGRPAALFVVTVVSIALSGCGDSGADGATSAQVAPPRPEVISAIALPVERVELVVPVVGTGTIAAAKTTDIGPRVDGIIQEIYVKVGDRVREFDALFKTRDTDLLIRKNELRHALNLAEAEVEKAQRDVARFTRLQGSGAVSISRLDDAQTQNKIAVARMGIARSALDLVRQQLRDTIVRAPFDGTITRRNVDEGVFLSTLVPGGNSAVVQIQKIDIVSAIVQIPEIHLPHIQLGTPGKVRIDGLDRVFESEVNIINDRIDERTRAVEVRLTLKNPDYLIKPGLFARAELFPPARQALVLERRAVLGSGGSNYVYVHRNGRAERRSLNIRGLDAERVEVLEGLVEGEDVLAGPNLPQIHEGTPIRLVSGNVAG